MEKLAILGGKPVLPMPLPEYRSIGEAEKLAVQRVMESGSISAFFGSMGDKFYGGNEVKALEKAWCELFKVNHAISVNSATSGLLAAIGAVGVGPGDEVIVPPLTMSATVVTPLFYGGIPVFADIDQDDFCISVESVKQKISPKTKAIVAVNLFGHPAKLHELRAFADQKGIYLIEDNAQGPFATENGVFAGTIGHIGIFSLNYHKHIHSGEGGVCVTNDNDLALRLALIRNHGENCVESLGIKDISNLVGLNLRLTEVQAAIALEQIRARDQHMSPRLHLAERLSSGLANLPGITVPKVRVGCEHSYYCWVARFDEKIVGCTREDFSNALKAEGVPHLAGYLRPLYKLPVFQQKIAIGKSQFPFNTTQVDYRGELCPNAERLHYKEMLTFQICAYQMTDALIDKVIAAWHKVYEQRRALADHRASHLSSQQL